MSTKKYILWILTLIFIDQIIKIIINSYFLKSKFEIVPYLLEFRPTYSKGTYLLNLLNIKIEMGILIVFYFIILCLLIIFYNLVRKARKNTTLFDFAFIFIIVAHVCYLIGCIFWEKGCLDYIYLKSLFIFDLKDLYIDCFICLFIVFMYKQQIHTFKDLVELTKQIEHNPLNKQRNMH
jgi:hypothetical protein